MQLLAAVNARIVKRLPSHHLRATKNLWHKLKAVAPTTQDNTRDSINSILSNDRDSQRLSVEKPASASSTHNMTTNHPRPKEV